MTLLYFYGWADYPIYNKFCESNHTSPEKSVFIFPGNQGHHRTMHNLYSRKGGAGLAAFTGSLGDKGLPVLSLPTTGMNNWATDITIQSTVNGAVEDLWKAVGAGYDLVLPVREFDSENNKFFDNPLEKKLEGFELEIEPSFWGENLKTPNKPLAKFYIDHLNLLNQFMAVKDTDKEESFLSNLEKNHPDLIAAFRQGKEMRPGDPWLQNPVKQTKSVVQSPSTKQIRSSPISSPPSHRLSESTVGDTTMSKSPVQHNLVNNVRKSAILKLLNPGIFQIEDFEQEGIFRVSGSATTIKDLNKKVLEANFESLDNIESTHDKTGLLKLLFRDLRDNGKQPLLNGDSRDALLKASKLEDSNTEKLEQVKQALSTLSEEDKLILSRILKLCEDASQHEASNKMSKNNLAIVMAPNIVELQGIGMDGFKEQQEITSIFTFMLKNQAAISQSLNVDAKAKDIESSLDHAIETDPRIHLFNKLKAEIVSDDKQWEVGLFGGKTIDIDGNKKKVVPHHVAELYEVCKQSTLSTVDQDIQRATNIINDRNIPKGVKGWIKSILKKLDVLNLFSRKPSTETFYKDKLKDFKEATGEAPSESSEPPKLS